MARNILKSSLLNAGFSIIFQVFCRLITFCINAFIVRSVGREILGIMNVRLLLLESTILFLSREAINRAALSATSQQHNKCSWPQIVNQIWLTVPICGAICIPLCYIWLYVLSSVDINLMDQYNFACYAVAWSCVIELCAEVPVFLTQVFCFVRLKILLNTLHIFVRSIIFLWIVLNDEKIAINAFAIAQLSSAFIILIGHYGFFYYYNQGLNKYREMIKKDTQNMQNDIKATTKTFMLFDQNIYEQMDDYPFKKISDFFPTVLPNDDKWLNRNLQTLTLSFIKQGILKQILTEGEKYVMSMSPVLNFSEQATYDVVNNIGSLAARFIFRPIEDNSYFYFTQTIARDIDLKEQKRTIVLQAGKVLSNISMVVTSIGLLALTFGQSYSHAILLLYGGADFVKDGLPEQLLQWHCLAILFLAVNGITEGYMFATNTSKDIDRYNYLMAIFSISFLILSYVLTAIFGPVGFIFANCINMFCRICYSTNFIWKKYKNVDFNPLWGLFPGKTFCLTLIFVGIACKYSMYRTQSLLNHLAFGGFGVFVSLICWSFEHLDLVKLGWHYAQRKKTE